MVKYELLYIIPAKYTEPEMKSLTEKIAGLVAAADGSVSASHDLGRRKLEYRIKQVQWGNYILVHFESEPMALLKMNDTLRLSTDVLRHLIMERNAYLTAIPSLVETEEMRRPREEGQSMARIAVQAKPAPIAVKEHLSMEQLDKKLDEILTEEIL